MKMMQHGITFLLLTGLCFGEPGAGAPVLRPGDRVAVVGDSITEQKQYSKFMELYLLACVPQLELTMFQFGWSGDRAPGFANRMENDFELWKPTLVTMCYGMNDGSYKPYEEATGKAYENGMIRIVERCKNLGARMILGGPGAVDTETWRKDDPGADLYYNDTLAKLSAIDQRLAAEHGFVYAGMHPLMMRVMRDAKAVLGDGYPVCGNDGVHPSANGHLVMAYAFLKAMGLDGNIGTITMDMNGSARATEGHRVVSSGDGTAEIESSRYPFCFIGGETDPNGNRSILPFLPFNEDLNRFQLVVKNLSAAEADVKWGNVTKTFSRDELEAGINLAGAFPDNPFIVPFRELETKVIEKQNRETKIIKGFITNMRDLSKNFPDDPEVEEAMVRLREKLINHSARDAASVRAAVTPVTHRITVMPKS